MDINNIKSQSTKWLSLEDLPSERWKDIAGYEGLYQISDYGRVKGLKRNIILKEAYNAKGYAQLCLTKNNVKKPTKYID